MVDTDGPRPELHPAHRPWRVPMMSRDRHEQHRVATPIELLFDLCFVVAVAQAGVSLHHALAEGHVSAALPSYFSVFFAIWWAWMNFTWFASAYDTDDVLYRLAVFVQIAGALIIAAGIPRAFDDHDWKVATVGYVIMRFGLVANWIRASRSDPATQVTARRFAIGVSACQVGWIALVILPGLLPWGFALMVACELLVPVWAERAEGTAWHPHHIAERYGLFTIIVLGESILAGAAAFQVAFEEQQANVELYATAFGGLVIVFTLWWLYFAKPAGPILEATEEGFIWGYGHYLVFGSAAALGAGLAVVIDVIDHAAHTTATMAGAAVTVPATVFLVVLWLLQIRPYPVKGARAAPYLVGAVLVLASTVLGTGAVVATGAVLVGVVVACTIMSRAPAGARGGTERSERPLS